MSNEAKSKLESKARKERASKLRAGRITSGEGRTSALAEMLNKASNTKERKFIESINSRSSTDGVLGRFAGISDRSMNVGVHTSDAAKSKEAELRKRMTDSGITIGDKEEKLLKKAGKTSFTKSISGGISGMIENMHTFALNRDEFLSNEFTTRNSAARTLNYINPLNASARSDMLNGLGFLTKAQKTESTINKSNAMKLFTRGFAGYGAYESIKEGDDPITSTVNTAASFWLVGGAMTIGRGVGGTLGVAASRLPAYANMLKKGSSVPYKIGTLGKVARIGGAVLGEIGGLAAGIALTSTELVSEGLKTITKSDGYFNRKGDNLLHDGQYASEFQSQETMTMRQRALAKMSKSGINDRSMALGNEAMILRGMM